MKLEYTITPAAYAKDRMAVRCPSDNHFKSRAAIILESVNPSMRFLRFSHRERAYIVSKRMANQFKAACDAWEANNA